MSTSSESFINARLIVSQVQAIVDQYHPHEEKHTATKVRFAAEPSADDRNDDHLFNDADVSALIIARE